MPPTSIPPAPDAELTIGAVAHGGHCVARLDGRVVFVRHALPGERVLARFTDAPEGAASWRADAIEVLEASPDRVPAAWPEAGAGGVGGGELSHVRLEAQRRWKSAVLAEQLNRLAKRDVQVEVEGVTGDDGRAGLSYRTRIDLVADAQGRAGMHRHRSHEVIALEAMPLASTAVSDFARHEGVFTRHWAPGSRIEVAVPAAGGPGILLVDGVPGHAGRADRRPNARRSVTEVVTVGGRELRYRVAADGFWQVHEGAPAFLVEAMLAGAGEIAGARVLDLYSGAGLFTLPLAHAVGRTGSVVAVESDERAVRDARRTLHDHPQVDLDRGAVDRVLRARAGERVDVVVLDPPRKGAGRKVVELIASAGPQRVVYVACDPAALARDVAYFADHGYELDGLRAFDLFPHTHHMEAVAVLTAGGGRG